MEYGEDRSRDLARAYHLYVSTHRLIVMGELYAFLAHTAAPRFYVSETRACQVVSAMNDGKKDACRGMRRQKREMFKEIHKRAMVIAEDEPDMPFRDIIRKVIRQQAPTFYMSVASIKACLCRMRKEWREKGYYRIPASLRRHHPGQ